MSGPGSASSLPPRPDGTLQQTTHICTLSPVGVVLRQSDWSPNPSGLGGGKRGKVTGYSKASAGRLRRFLVSNHVPVGPEGRVMAITYTVPGEVTPEEWRATMKRQASLFLRVGVAMVWRVELQKRKQPHLHALVFLPDGTAEQWLAVGTTGWLSCLPEHCREHPHASKYAVHQVVGSLEGGGAYPGGQWLGYLVGHSTKSKKSQLGWQGRQWGVVNRKLFVPYPTDDLGLYPQEAHKFNRLRRRWLRNRVDRKRWRYMRHGNHGFAAIIDPGVIKKFCRWLLMERHRLDDRGERSRYLTKPPVRYALRRCPEERGL